MARVSVIMGVYNCATTLDEALESLLSQTYQDFKVVMCDDGSTDNTAVVAQQFVDRFPDKFLLIKNESNRGLNYTLNHCLQYVDTEFIARMDGDDISLPERFEKQVAFLESHPDIAVVSTPMIYFDEHGDFRIGKANPEPDKNSFIQGTPLCHAPCMARTKVVKEVKGYTVDPRLLRVEDYHLWFKIYAAGHKLANLEEPLYKMRDDRNAKLRRNWQARKNEMYVKYTGFKMLELPWYKFIWILRPLAAHLAPGFIYNYIHASKVKR